MTSLQIQNDITHFSACNKWSTSDLCTVMKIIMKLSYVNVSKVEENTSLKTLFFNAQVLNKVFKKSDHTPI